MFTYGKFQKLIYVKFMENQLLPRKKDIRTGSMARWDFWLLLKRVHAESRCPEAPVRSREKMKKKIEKGLFHICFYIFIVFFFHLSLFYFLFSKALWSKSKKTSSSSSSYVCLLQTKVLRCGCNCGTKEKDVLHGKVLSNPSGSKRDLVKCQEDECNLFSRVFFPTFGIRNRVRHTTSNARNAKRSRSNSTNCNKTAFRPDETAVGQEKTLSSQIARQKNLF